MTLEQEEIRFFAYLFIAGIYAFLAFFIVFSVAFFYLYFKAQQDLVKQMKTEFNEIMEKIKAGVTLSITKMFKKSNEKIEKSLPET